MASALAVSSFRPTADLTIFVILLFDQVPAERPREHAGKI
jgi:hypothetical protein